MSKFIFVLLGAILNLPIYGAAANPTLPIAERLEQQPVLLLGWGHSSSNLIIPEILLDEIKILLSKGEQLSLVIEWPKGMPEAFYSSAEATMASLGKTIDEARNLGVEIIAGNHPGVSPWSHVAIPEQDRHLAAAVRATYKGNRKVILIVGSAHLLGVSRNLRDASVPFTSILTNYNVLTGEVRWGEKSLGFSNPDPRFADIRRDAPRERWNKIGWSWKGTTDPDKDYLYQATSFLKRTFWPGSKACEKALSDDIDDDAPLSIRPRLNRSGAHYQ